MFQEPADDVFHFNKLKNEYNVLIKKLNIIPGAVLKSKVYFFSWSIIPGDPESFNSGSIFTVVDITVKDGECILQCFQDNRIFEIDALTFHFNSANLHLEDRSLEDLFSIYFEKIL